MIEGTVKKVEELCIGNKKKTHLEFLCFTGETGGFIGTY